MTRLLSRTRLGAATVLTAFSVLAAGSLAAAPTASASGSQATKLAGLLRPGTPAVSAMVAKHGQAHADGWAAWRGSSVPVVVDYLASSSWASMRSQQWAPQRWPGDKYLVVYSMPILPSDGTGNLATGATGAYNATFRAIAQQLVAGGDGYSVIRPGWEMTGDWFRWNGLQDAASYRSYFRQIVTTMRAVPGAHFAFDWNIADTTNDPRPMYPGDDVVDIVGMDIYDSSYATSYPATDHVRTWEHHVSKPYGLTWLGDFAQAHDKRISFPEWGLVHRCDAHGGGDNPYFVQKMSEWVRSHDVAYQAYFDDNDNSCKRFELRSSDFPHGAAAYLKYFGASTTSAPGRFTRSRAAAASSRPVLVAPAALRATAPGTTLSLGRSLSPWA